VRRGVGVNGEKRRPAENPKSAATPGARNRGDCRICSRHLGELAEAYISVDIRRTVRTGLSGRLRADPSHRVGSDIAERVFGHVIGGVR
jgi:hypothetical protein